MRLLAFTLAASLLLPSPSRAAEPAKHPPPPAPWPTPRVLARAVFDPPFGPGFGVTVFPVDRWSVSADLLSRGPYGPFYELGLHFWPRAPRGTHHRFGVGVGGDLLATNNLSSGGFAALCLGSVDLHYLGRPHREIGFVLGGKVGLGAAFEARDFGDHARHGRALDHLGFQLLNYVGFSLGSRR